MILKRPVEQSADQAAQYSAVTDNGQVVAGLRMDSSGDRLNPLVKLREGFPAGEGKSGCKFRPLINLARVLFKYLGEGKTFPCAKVDFMQLWINTNCASQVFAQGMRGLACTPRRAAPESINGRRSMLRHLPHQPFSLPHARSAQRDIAAPDVVSVQSGGNGGMSDQGEVLVHPRVSFPHIKKSP